ncbi:hypothetical protein GQ457_18G012420 [Hibiscus cannabinus]
MSHVNSSSSQRQGHGGRQVWTLFVRNLSDILHWQSLWQCFDRHMEVLDVFVPTKRTVDGSKFGFVRMGSWEDALRVIEHLDGFVLYGSRVRISFTQRDTHDSFWRKKGSLPRLPDPPSHFPAPIFDRDTTLRAEGPKNCQCWKPVLWAAARLDGFEIMWVAGLMVLLAFLDANSRQLLLSQDFLSTCFDRLEDWTTSAEYVSRRAWLSISGLPIHLWSEGSFCNIVGLWSMYLRVDVATEEPASFKRARILIETSVRGRIDEVVEVASLGTMFFIVVQEVELVWVPTVEQRGVVDGAALSEQSQEASVASPRKNSPIEQVGDDSSRWHANQLWETKSAGKGRGTSMVVGGASDRVVCDCGGVYNEGDVDFALTGIRSREGLDIVQPSMFVAERDSLGVKVVSDCESAEQYGRVVSVNGEGSPSTSVLGLAGAAAAPVIGSAHGGARKVKRGRGRSAKVSRVEEAGRVVANKSLTDSDIQACQRYLQSEAEATFKLWNLIGVCTTSCEQDII